MSVFHKTIKRSVRIKSTKKHKHM